MSNRNFEKPVVTIESSPVRVPWSQDDLGHLDAAASRLRDALRRHAEGRPDAGPLELAYLAGLDLARATIASEAAAERLEQSFTSTCTEAAERIETCVAALAPDAPRD